MRWERINSRRLHVLLLRPAPVAGRERMRHSEGLCVQRSSNAATHHSGCRRLFLVRPSAISTHPLQDARHCSCSAALALQLVASAADGEPQVLHRIRRVVQGRQQPTLIVHTWPAVEADLQPIRLVDVKIAGRGRGVKRDGCEDEKGARRWVVIGKGKGKAGERGDEGRRKRKSSH